MLTGLMGSFLETLLSRLASASWDLQHGSTFNLLNFLQKAVQGKTSFQRQPMQAFVIQWRRGGWNVKIWSTTLLKLQELNLFILVPFKWRIVE